MFVGYSWQSKPVFTEILPNEFWWEHDFWAWITHRLSSTEIFGLQGIVSPGHERGTVPS